MSKAIALVTAMTATLSLAALTPYAHAEDVIRIGAPLPLTGPLSPEGLKQ